MQTRSITCPSGATLVVAPAPFAVSKALYQALLREIRGITFATGFELANVFKDALCAGFSSPDVDRTLAECMKRCTYNTLKIDDTTFEPVEARGDYILVCMEVVRENVGPFMKSLYAEFVKAQAEAEKVIGNPKST